DLDATAPGGDGGSPLAIMRAGLLYREGLYAEARRELMAAIVQDPDEPTLRQLLGYVYDRVGLIDLAAQGFAEAAFLTARKPCRPGEGPGPRAAEEAPHAEIGDLARDRERARAPGSGLRPRSVAARVGCRAIGRDAPTRVGSQGRSLEGSPGRSIPRRP